MSQSHDALSSLAELAPASPPPDAPSQLPSCSQSEALDPEPLTQYSGAPPSVQIDNFVAPLLSPDELESHCESVLSAAEAVLAAPLAVVADDEHEVEPDDSSSVVCASTLAPASVHADTVDMQQQREQLLLELQHKTLAIQANVELERQRQHSAMLLALEQRKAAVVLRLAAEVGDECEDASPHRRSSALQAEAENEREALAIDDAATNEQEVSAECIAVCEGDGSSEHEGDGSSVIEHAPDPDSLTHENTDTGTCFRRSRSSSPMPSSRLQHLRPDTRIDIPSPHFATRSEVESARDKSLSGHWLLRQQNVDPGIHAQLTEMGFDSRIAVVALERTGSASLQGAIEFCLDHNSEHYPGAHGTEGGDSDSSPDISVSASLTRCC